MQSLMSAVKNNMQMLLFIKVLSLRRKKKPPHTENKISVSTLETNPTAICMLCQMICKTLHT